MCSLDPYQADYNLWGDHNRRTAFSEVWVDVEQRPLPTSVSRAPHRRERDECSSVGCAIDDIDQDLAALTIARNIWLAQQMFGSVPAAAYDLLASNHSVRLAVRLTLERMAKTVRRSSRDSYVGCVQEEILDEHLTRL